MLPAVAKTLKVRECCLCAQSFLFLTAPKSIEISQYYPAGVADGALGFDICSSSSEGGHCMYFDVLPVYIYLIGLTQKD